VCVGNRWEALWYLRISRCLWGKLSGMGAGIDPGVVPLVQHGGIWVKIWTSAACSSAWFSVIFSLKLEGLETMKERRVGDFHSSWMDGSSLMNELFGKTEKMCLRMVELGEVMVRCRSLNLALWTSLEGGIIDSSLMFQKWSGPGMSF
jgi:hypothetical protein